MARPYRQIVVLIVAAVFVAACAPAPTSTPSPTAVPPAPTPPSAAPTSPVPTAIAAGTRVTDGAPLPTPAVAATAVPVLQPTPAISPASGVVVLTNQNANLRGGPGTDYAIVGGVDSGQNLTAVGRNADGSWLLLDNDAWIAAFLITIPVENLATLPEATARTAEAATPESAADPAVSPSIDYGALVGDPAVQEYAQQMTLYAEAFSNALNVLGGLFADASENPLLLADDTWRTRVTTEFATIRMVNDAIRSLTPPEALAPLHDQLLVAAQHFDKAIEYYTLTLNNFDLAAIGPGTAELQAGFAALEEAEPILVVILD